MIELLLHPPIPSSLLGVNPRRLVPQEWAVIRADALARAGARCVVCGCEDRLEVHESYVYDYDGNIATYVTAFPLCVPCHRFVHLEITMSRWLSGDLTTDVVVGVVNHGATLLWEAGPIEPTLCQMYQMVRLSWWPDVHVGEAVTNFIIAAGFHPRWEPDVSEWKLQWRGDLYKEVVPQEYEFDTSKWDV